MNKIILLSNQQIYKQKVLQYGRMSRQRNVTYDRFEKWLEKRGYYLSSEDNLWRPTFYSILRSHFQTELNYKFNKEGKQLITIFKVGNLLRL